MGDFLIEKRFLDLSCRNIKHCCWTTEWLYTEVLIQGLFNFTYQVFVLCMEVHERMLIYMEEKDYLQNRCCVPTASYEGANEVPKKSVLYQKIRWILRCLLTLYNTKANFPILESVMLQPMKIS